MWHIFKVINLYRPVAGVGDWRSRTKTQESNKMGNAFVFCAERKNIFGVGACQGMCWMRPCEQHTVEQACMQKWSTSPKTKCKCMAYNRFSVGE